MKIIIGLGNPGKEYEGTRHNTGYMFVDAMASCREITPVNEVLTFHTNKKFEADLAETEANGEKIILAKPKTFMNLSGNTVSKLLLYYKAKPEDLIVIHDDIDLPLGVLRIRKEGSSGGQKGVQNIIDQIKSENFVRVRIGTSITQEKVDKTETARFVLDRFNKRELPILKKAIAVGMDYIITFLGSEKEIPCHTIEVAGKEERPNKV